MGVQSTAIDADTGLPSTYSSGINTYISYDGLLSPAPGSNSVAMSHPFPSLRALYEDLGSTAQIQLNNDVADFTVTPEKFVALEYPVSTTEPTKNITRTYVVESPKYVNETTHHPDKKEANVGACVILSLLLVACIVIAIVMLIKMMNEKDKTAGYIGT